MVLAWEPALPYGLSELESATDWLMRNPQAFDKHRAKSERYLDGIHRAVLEGRSIEARDRTQAGEKRDWGKCSRCDSTGHVTVPNLADVIDGEWRPCRMARSGPAYYTYAVACECGLGRWMNARRKKPLLTIAAYEARNPSWRTHLEDREAEQAMQRAGFRMGKEDEDRYGLGKQIERLTRQWGL